MSLFHFLDCKEGLPDWLLLCLPLIVSANWEVWEVVVSSCNNGERRYTILICPLTQAIHGFFVVPYYFGHYFMILYCLHNYMALASFENQASVQLAYIVCSHPYCWRPLCLLLLCGFINAGQFEMYSVSYMKNYFSVKYVSFNSNYTKIIGHKNLYHEDFPWNKI